MGLPLCSADGTQGQPMGCPVGPAGLIPFRHVHVIISGSSMSQRIRRAGTGAAQHGRVI
jgi:hypothetical protein